MSEQELISDIYEAVAFPDRWPRVLERIGLVADTPAVMLLTRRADDWVGCTASDSLRESIEAYVASTVPQRSKTTSRLLAANHAGFLTDCDLFSDTEWEKEPFRNEWARRWGWNHATATAIEIPSGDFLVVQAQRAEKEPPFGADEVGRLNELRPHLARAGLLASRWRLQQLRSATEALALLGLPAAVLDQQSRVLASNDLMSTLTNHVRWMPRDRITLVDPSANKRLLQTGTLPQSMSVPSCPSGVEPAIVHVVPLVKQTRDIFDGGLRLLIITEAGPLSAPSGALIKQLFDLTASETKIAQALTQGKSVRQIASDARVGEATIRSHLKAVLAKTATSRQSELIVKLLGLSKGLRES